MKFVYVAYLLSFGDSSGLLCGVLMWAELAEWTVFI
jgi:hypothetical protein